jgi:hypothetical protein
MLEMLDETFHQLRNDCPASIAILLRIKPTFFDLVLLLILIFFMKDLLGSFDVEANFELLIYRDALLLSVNLG